MEKIIITGVSSFIGVHLAKFFSKKFKVFGTISGKKEDYKNIYKIRLNSISKSVTIIENFNLIDHITISNTISNIKPDFFIHHAGWANSYASIDYDLVRSYQTNVIPLSVIFSSLKKNKCKGIIITGSSSEYSDGDLPDLESDSCYPSMPYGFSILFQTIYAHQLSNYYNLPTRIARVYIPFGPLDSPNKLIPFVIKSLKNNELAKLSSCKQTRDFIYIDELVKIYQFLINDLKNEKFEIYNCASGNPLQLKLVLTLIAEQMNKSIDLLAFSQIKNRKSEPEYSYANIDKLKEKYSDISDLDISMHLKNYIKSF